jgi:hypothetical protein
MKVQKVMSGYIALRAPLYVQECAHHGAKATRLGLGVEY